MIPEPLALKILDAPCLSCFLLRFQIIPLHQLTKILGQLLKRILLEMRIPGYAGALLMILPPGAFAALASPVLKRIGNWPVPGVDRWLRARDVPLPPTTSFRHSRSKKEDAR